MMNRGRLNLEGLDDDELLQFEHVYIIFLNTVEGWNRSVQETTREKQYRMAQEQNIKELINDSKNRSIMF
jgi:uncharacterized membrane protein